MQRTYNCAVELALDVLGAKWKPVILAHLKQAPLRYGELRARVPRMNDKMLTQRLRELTAAGFITRHGARYTLTAEGEQLRPLLDALHRWGLARARAHGIVLVAERV